MLTRKGIAVTAIVLIVVFGVTIITYPLIFNPTTTSTDESPANMPVAPAPL